MAPTCGGASGSSRGCTPRGFRAAATALAITPPTGMMPPSPAPLAPSGLCGGGFFSGATRPETRKIPPGGQQVVGQCPGEQLRVGIVDEMLHQGAAEPLNDRPHALAVQRVR